LSRFFAAAPCNAARAISSLKFPLELSTVATTTLPETLRRRVNSPPPAAPRASGARLIQPPVESVGELLANNRRIIASASYDVQGMRLADLATAGQRQLLAAALRYTRSYRDVPEPSAEPSSIILAGHQPELFHPGVWLKNFVLGSLARQHGAAAVNLVIDSDTIKASALRIPGGSIASPTVEAVPFDTPSAEIPFQARRIQDRQLFDSFGRRAAERLAPLVANPLLGEFWPLVVECAERTANLGECLAQARHRWEGRWNLTTLEIPQSHVCNLEAFHRLTAHLMAHLPRFWEIYNSALADYRTLYHVRSHAHPAPELAADGPWLEAPYWIWTDDDPRRRRVFARATCEQSILTDRQGLEIVLRLSPECDAASAIEQLAALAARGIHLGSRALLTTLAARLLLGDLFLHGIGGAKYDRLTDTIIERFFGVEAPAYMVVSGTLHLPIVHCTASTDQLRAVENRLRELTFHPEQFLVDSIANGAALDGGTLDGPGRWIAEKRRWIAQRVARTDARRRNDAIRHANEQLQPWVASERLQLAAEAESLGRQLRAAAILCSRSYGFCLYPEEILRNFLLEFPGTKP
jgi:hypothetical protein